ncbi:ADP-ribosyl cyclase/cyclic ADP-ribose hydrolase-like [Saccoglossus kowalevskii]
MALLDVIYLLFSSVVTLCVVCSATDDFTGPGTLPSFKRIVIGRCEDFKQGYVNPRIDKEELSNMNCTEIWNSLESAVAFREPCDVIKEDYQHFISLTKHTHDTDSALFWDGWDVYDTVTEYAFRGNRRTSLDTTLIGYTGNYLSFCGSTTHPSGFDTEACPAEGECGFGVGSIDAFWAAASTYFAEYARGDTKVFFNSNRPGGAFQSNNSYFAQYELAILTSEDVASMNINLITLIGETPGDTCTSASIIELERILDEKGIAHNCVENSPDVMHMMCIDHIGDDECTGIYEFSGQQPITVQWQWYTILILTVIGFRTT